MKKVMDKQPLNIIFIENFHIYKKYSQVETVGGIETNTWDVINTLKRKGHNVWIPSEDKQEPKWVQSNEVDIVASSTFDPLTLWQMYNLKKKYNCTIIQHAHTSLDDMEGGFLPDIKIFNTLMRFYLKYLYSVSHLIITPTEFSKKSLKRLNLKKRPPIYAVSNGIKVEKFKEKKEYRENFRKFLNDKYDIPLDATIILDVGYTWERKGPEEFWKCAKELPEYWFVWVGPIKDFAKTLPPLKNCIFTGFYKNICEAYYGADLLLFPSLVENQGIPLMEAAICNLPIVTRGIEPIDWLIHDESCVKAKSHKEFINGIEKIFNDSTFREKITKNAYSVTEKLHNFKKIGDKVEKLYYRAIKLKNLYLQRTQKQ